MESAGGVWNVNGDMKTLPESKLHELRMFYHKYEAMANIYDMAIELAIIDYVNPNTIWELGAASGHWSAAMQHLMTHKECHFTLVENFKEATLYKDIGVPQDAVELKNYLHAQFDFRPDLIIKSMDDLPSAELKIDVLRVDCDTESKYHSLSKWILFNGSDNLIVFVDDVRPNARPDRLFMMQDLVNRGLLEFLWGGEEEAAWCSPKLKLDRKHLHSHLLSLYSDSYEKIHRSMYEWQFGVTLDYITTRSKCVPGLAVNK